MRGALAVAMTIGIAAPASAIAPVSPAPDAKVGPFPTFQVSLGGGEELPRIVFWRSLKALQAGREPETITTDDSASGMRPFLPLEPGAMYWAPRAYQGREKVTGEPRKLVVRRIVRMTKVNFKRKRGEISGSYVWRTNAPRLRHVLEVIHNGKRVKRQRSVIAHSPSRRWKGETWNFHTSLSDNTPPFGFIHPGVWRVRITIAAGPNRETASRRYVIR